MCQKKIKLNTNILQILNAILIFTSAIIIHLTNITILLGLLIVSFVMLGITIITISQKNRWD